MASGATLDIQTVGGALTDTATLTVADDSDTATGVTLGAGIAETVYALVLGGVAQVNTGSYGSSASGADYQLDANWDDAFSGGVSVTWQNVPPCNAVFGGAAGTVELDGAVTVGGMAFITGGYTVADTNGNGTLTLSGAPTVWVDTGLDAAIGEELSGANGFVKAGTGRLTLSATNILTLSGAVVVNEGTLRWGVSNALPNTPSASVPITVNAGATLDFGALQHGGVTYGKGSGSLGSSASAADHQSDEYFSGTGILMVPPSDGTLIRVR